MINKLVSVVIPSYNRAKTIRRAIVSVLNQTYDCIEVIVVDDCSQDDTQAVVESLHDNRVRFIRLEKNSGACIARNVGIDNARGEYIAFQDSDDEWLPDKLKKQIGAMEKEGKAVSFCAFNKINEETGLQKIEPQNLQYGIVPFNELLEKSVVSTQCIVAQKMCFSDVKFDPFMPRLQDWDIILQLAKKYDVLFVNVPLVNMYVQSESISSHPERGVAAMSILWKKHEKDIENNKEIERKWLIYLGNYKLASGKNPMLEYKRAIKLKFTKEIFIKYLLARIGIINKLYHKTGRLN